MRVRVRERLGFHQYATLLELRDNFVIRVAYTEATDDRDLGIEFPVHIDGLEKCQAMMLHGREVIGAERWRHVHHAAAILRGDKILGHDDLVVPLGWIGDPIEWALIPKAEKIGALHVTDYGPAFAEYSLHASGRQDQTLRATLDFDVIKIGANGKRDVGDQCPWRRGPDHDFAAVRQWQSDIDTRIRLVIVAERHFVAR